jgi:hypothetical protein
MPHLQQAGTLAATFLFRSYFKSFRHTMGNKVNFVIALIYRTLIAFLVLYIIIGIYSYYSVVYFFGAVPNSNELFKFAKTSKPTVYAFPVKYSELFLGIFSWLLLALPVFILINYSVHRFFSIIYFYKIEAVLSFLLFVATFVFFMKNSVLSWYLEYILD